MNKFLSPELQIEILEEERSQLMFVHERHYRWSTHTRNLENHHTHLRISAAIKSVADMYQELIDSLQKDSE